MCGYTFTLHFIIDNPDKSKVAKFSDFESLIFKPVPYIANGTWLLFM